MRIEEGAAPQGRLNLADITGAALRGGTDGWRGARGGLLPVTLGIGLVAATMGGALPSTVSRGLMNILRK